MTIDAAAIIAEARKRRRAGRRWSPMRRWLEDNHDDLASDPPSMTELARLLAQAGVKDGNGNKPTGMTLANAWKRVKTDRAVAAVTRRPRLGAPGRVDTSDTPMPDFRPLGDRRNQGEK